MRRGEIRLGGDGVLERREGLFRRALFLEDVAQVVVRLGVVGRRRDRAPDEVDGGPRVAPLVADDAHQVQRAGLVGLARQDIGAEPRGRVEPAGAVVAQRRLERLVRRCRAAAPGGLPAGLA